MNGWRRLCRLDALQDGEARGFPPAPGGFVGLVLLRCNNQPRVYLNACPHIGVPLNLQPDRFTDAAGQLMCSTHGALFLPENGLCVHGPCMGDHLEQVQATLDDGIVVVPANAGL